MRMIQNNFTDRAGVTGHDRVLRLIPGLLLLLWMGTLVLSGSARAATETVRWSHSDLTTVTGFKVLHGPASNSYDVATDVGMPAEVNGVFSASITVPDSRDNFIAVVAYNADGDSLPSNESFRPSGGPDPAPDDSTAPFPPRSDTVLSSDFENALDPAWYDTGANNSLMNDDSLFLVTDIGGSNALTTTSTATNIHSHYIGNGSSSWDDYEYRGRMRIASASSGIGVTAYSDYPNRDAYYRLRRRANDSSAAFGLTAHPIQSSTLMCSEQSTGVIPNVNTWYKFRIQTTSNVAGSTVIKAKVWAASGSEPSDWQAICQDSSSSRLLAGATGVWSTGSGTKAWDDLEVFPISASSESGSESSRPAPPILLNVVPVEP